MLYRIPVPCGGFYTVIKVSPAGVTITPSPPKGLKSFCFYILQAEHQLNKDRIGIKQNEKNLVANFCAEVEAIQGSDTSWKSGNVNEAYNIYEALTVDSM